MLFRNKIQFYNSRIIFVFDLLKVRFCCLLKLKAVLLVLFSFLIYSVSQQSGTYGEHWIMGKRVNPYYVDFAFYKSIDLIHRNVIFYLTDNHRTVLWS